MVDATGTDRQALQMLIDTQRLSQAGSGEALKMRLEELTQLQQVASARKTRFILLIAIALVAALASFTAFKLPLVTGVLAIATVMFWARAAYWGRLKIPEPRRLLAARVIELVERDSDAAELINLTLDLAPISKSENISYKAHLKAGRSFFESNWLIVSGRFADGTRYQLRLKETAVIKERKGKVKPKGTEISLLLAYQEKRYGGVAQIGDAARAISLPRGVQTQSLKLANNRLRLTARVRPSRHIAYSRPFSRYTGESSPAQLDLLYQTITMMLLSAYQILNLGRALAKR